MLFFLFFSLVHCGVNVGQKMMRMFYWKKRQTPTNGINKKQNVPFSSMWTPSRPHFEKIAACTPKVRPDVTDLGPYAKNWFRGDAADLCLHAQILISGRCPPSRAFRQELISRTCQRSLTARKNINFQEMSPIWTPKKHSFPQGRDPTENDGRHHPSNFHASDFLAPFSERRCRKNSVNQRVK